MSAVLTWYESLRPRILDLVSDYAGRELFLIEGDSLLLDCFNDERIDFEGILPVLPYISLELISTSSRWFPNTPRSLCCGAIP